MESNRYYKIDKWCKAGSGQQSKQKCKGKGHWVKPFRCLEGPFQSDALLVPEHCLFDHVHNQSVCQSPDFWNKTGAQSCQKRGMHLQSYAMLLPCGVGVFSGVEFVCCPPVAQVTTTAAPLIPEDLDDDSRSNSIAKEVRDSDSDKESAKEESDDDEDDEDEDEDDEDYYDDDYDDADEDVPSSTTTTTTTSTTTTTTTTERPIDVYLSHFDSQREHDSFKSAQKNLDESHRDKVTKVMKEWSELEEHYQEMKGKDPQGAEEFKKKMTSRFQKTVEALEEEGAAERRQLTSMHQQRVMTIINMRKKSAMDCFTQSLDQSPPKTKRIEKCMEKLFRALEKDRMHTLHHFRHMLTSNTKQALREKDAMLDHLENLIRMGNQSMQMLARVPSVSDKIRTRMLALWLNLRGSEQSLTRDSEQKIMDRYEDEVALKQQEKERLKMMDDERRQEMKELQQEKKKVEANQKNGKLDREFDPESMEDERTAGDRTVDSDSDESDDRKTTPAPRLLSTSTSTASSSHPFMESLERNEVHETVPTPKVAHIQNDGFHHNLVVRVSLTSSLRTNRLPPQTYSVRREPYHAKLKWNGSIYITLAFAGIALLTATIVGVVLLRKHGQRSPLSQGFVEVDQTASPEERHVANMQINGYENPTFKYFESQVA